MKRIKEIGKKGSLFLMALSMLCMEAPVSAASPQPLTREGGVWVDVLSPDLNAQISVTVPLVYGFVVNGTVKDAMSKVEISVSNKTLLLPNFTVEVVDHNRNDGPYRLVTEGSGGSFVLRNYSTCMNTSLRDNPDWDTTIRLGLPITLNAYIENYNKEENKEAKIDDPKDRGYWEVISEKPSKDLKYFKKYQIGFQDVWNDAEDEDLDSHVFTEKDSATGHLYLNKPFEVEAPPIENGFRINYAAVDSSRLVMDMIVNVGGERGQYKQVEESKRVGVITWMVHAEDPSES